MVERKLICWRVRWESQMGKWFYDWSSRERALEQARDFRADRLGRARNVRVMRVYKKKKVKG